MTPLASCKPAKDKVVDILTSTIMEPVSVNFSRNTDLGEIAVSNEPLDIIITVKNNSSKDIKKLDLSIASGQSLLKFSPTTEGLNISPGQDGTCGEVLTSYEECTYILSFIPRKIGKYTIGLEFKYENYIESQNKQFTIKAIVGEPAALSFTNDTSNYDLGVIEQTDTSKRILNLEIKNTGSLSARNIVFSLSNDNDSPAYEVVSNECPSTIPGGMSCKVSLSYIPRNNRYSDPSVNYTGKYTIEYTKDPSNNTGVLNAYLNFLSVTIEANFKQNFNTIEFPTIVTGNKEEKSIKISNAGYQKGIMKEILFHDYQGNLITKCIKNSNSLVLNCQKSLDTFPFIVEDSNNCLGREVKGIEGRTPGESCFFKIIYWPSTKWPSQSQSTYYFNDSTISLVYDSLWKNNENIVTKNNMFTIKADFLSAAKLVLDKVEIENIPLLDTDIFSANNVFEANLGRLALVSSASYYTFIKVTLKNLGESPAIVSDLRDGSTTGNQISDLGYDLNAFYRQIKHNSCTVIPPQGSCNISFNLTPIAQATPALEDQFMFDNTSNPLKKYKRFITSYDDGSVIEDDGSIAAKRNIEVKLISKLVRKGYLSIETNSFTFPTIVNGKSNVQNIFLKNVGTGDLYAVIKDAAKNLNPKAGQNNFPYKVLDIATPIAPATKDCHDIIFESNATPATLPVIPDSTKFLAPGESCVLSVENQLPPTTRELESDYPIALDYQRLYSRVANSTEEIWARRGYSHPTASISFKYYDGDANPDVPSSVPYGYLGTTKEITVTSNFRSPAIIVAKDPLPSTSALFDRPPLFYPAISTTYPTSITLASKSIARTYFDSSYFTLATHGFAKSKEAINHVKTLNLTGGIYDSEYKFHGGTFPVGETSFIQYTYSNVGMSSATNVILVEESKPANYPIQIESFNNMTAKPFPNISITPSQNVLLKFKFTPTAPGLYKRCYTLEYDNALISNQEYHMCVYVEAVTNYPKIQISYKNVTVTQSGQTVTESEVGSYQTLNTPLNDTDITSVASFSAIKASIVYAKKIIRFTNTGSSNVTKFSYYYMDSPNNAATNLPADTTIFTTGLPYPCLPNMTLAVGSYCEIYIKYAPTASSATTVNRYIGAIYDMAPSLNQFVSNTGFMQFLALDPAKLVMNMPGINSEVVTDWSNPSTPIPLNISWPVNIGSYGTNATPPHLLLTNKPSIKRITNIEIKNTSALKASFLSMNPTPTADEWNVILSNSSATIWANRYCFFGDDENNSAIADEDKGFNSSSTNKCYLQVDFSGFLPYDSCSAWNAPVKTKNTTFGQNIVANCNPFVYTLTYWNYKRAAQSTIPIHIKGFIEPNRVRSVTPIFSDVTSVNTGGTSGSVSFIWPALTPVDAGWGNIIKYRIYYDTNYSNLSSVNVFKLNSTIPYKETTDANIRNITISSLAAGNYYFFKVFAVQSYNAVTPNLKYISNSNLPILALPIPTTNQIYSHQMKILIDKTFKATSGTRTTGINTCASDFYSLNITGTARKLYKTLINTNVFNYLISNSTYSTGYPSEGIGSIPHWLSDGAYDLKTSLSLFDGSIINGFPDYNPASIAGNSPSNQLLFQKTCNNNSSCDLLYKVAGGDGVDMYYNGVFYTTPTAISAYFRCYGVILCPNNPAKAITDPTCSY